MQGLSLEPHTSDPFVILKATGELDLHTQDEFERVVSRLLGTSPVVVDLSALEFLAISALRSLMVCHQLAGTTANGLCYAGPTRQTRRLLEVSGLDLVLPVASSVALAVGSSAAVDGLADQSLRHLTKLDVG